MKIFKVFTDKSSVCSGFSKSVFIILCEPNRASVVIFIKTITKTYILHLTNIVLLPASVRRHNISIRPHEHSTIKKGIKSL